MDCTPNSHGHRFKRLRSLASKAGKRTVLTSFHFNMAMTAWRTELEVPKHL